MKLKIYILTFSKDGQLIKLKVKIVKRKMLRLLNNTKEIKFLGGILLKVVNVILVKPQKKKL